MPTFEYRAKEGPVKTVHGVVEAQSRAAALSQLDRKGLTPVWVREKSTEKKRIGLRFQRRVTFRDVTVFTGQLASLTRSGVPILRTMATIADQTENSRLKIIVKEMEGIIRDGNMLSAALSNYPSIFPELYIHTIRAGESAGVLDTILVRLEESREREEDIRRKVQAAIAYPLLIISVGIATVFILLTFFLPKVVDLFRGYRDLPLPTRILIGTSDFFSANWYWMLLIGVLLGAILKRLAAMEKGRTFFDGIKLRMPLLGRFIKESEISRFARTLALLIEVGIPIDRALALSANTMRNSILRDDVDTIRRETVEQGTTLSSGLRRSKHFPALVTNMAAVGEEGGKLDESMNEVAAYYEKQCDQLSRVAVSLLEPLLILVVGGIVGFIVASMLLPIFELGTGL